MYAQVHITSMKKTRISRTKSRQVLGITYLCEHKIENYCRWPCICMYMQVLQRKAVYNQSFFSSFSAVRGKRWFIDIARVMTCRQRACSLAIPF